MKNLRNVGLLGLSASLALVACGDDEEKTPSLPENTTQAVSNYAEIVSASYEDSLAAAMELDTAVDAFIADPTDATLSAARQAWLDSREPYLQTEVYRFYDGPIDNADDGPEGLLNAWPLDEAYIDYVEGDATAGIVNDASITISADTLLELNEQGGEANVATGYHAIEFLLWGQDMDTEGAGNRPVADYLTDGGTANADRRAAYLGTVSDLLVQHLQDMVDAWDASAANNYRATWDAAEPIDGLANVLTGMIVLSGFETGGERLQTALDSHDQEDEHSCFSDNTHRDMIQDIQGVQNVWLGSYTRLDGSTVSGPGIQDVIAAVDADLATQITTQIAESLSLANALQPPFDQEIASGNTEGNARVAALITSLQTQESLLEDAFRAFDLDIPVVE